jgi:hypothetical protein
VSRPHVAELTRTAPCTFARPRRGVLQRADPAQRADSTAPWSTHAVAPRLFQGSEPDGAYLLKLVDPRQPEKGHTPHGAARRQRRLAVARRALARLSVRRDRMLGRLRAPAEDRGARDRALGGLG